MVPKNIHNRTIDPVEKLNGVLDDVWYELCSTFDATADLPGMETLFTDADLSRPGRTAQTVIVNMLLEVMECIGRFSPWYTKPARTFGLTSIRDPFTKRTRWSLAPEAVLKWQRTLEELAIAVRANSGMLQALMLVEGLMNGDTQDDPCITARCGCLPPRTIQITGSVLTKSEILCDVCCQPYR
jgi:hypothetical protein